MTEEDTFNRLKRKPLSSLEYEWDFVDGVYEKWIHQSPVLPWTTYLNYHGWSSEEYNKWALNKHD